MSTDNPQEVPATLETVAKWAHSNREWDRVYRYLFLHPNDFFVIPPTRRWPISHQVVYHGDVDLLKRILVLFSNDDINIRTKSLDEKTLLDVATQRREKKPDMFNYVDRLFTQDELIVQAKNSNWAEIKKILEKNNNLANEKPPYSPYFLLHYIVQNGNARILQDFLSSFQFLTNLLNNRNETPLNMAKRLLKQDICRILEPRTLERSPFINNQPETPPPPSEHLYRSDERVTFHAATSLSNESIPYDTLSSMPPLPTQTIDTKPKLPPIGFSGIVVDITENGDFTFGPSTLVNSGVHPQMPPLPQPQQQAPPKQPPQPTTSTLTRRVNRSIIQEVPLTNMESPPPPPPPPPRPSPLTAAASSATNEQLKKNLTCPLSQEIFKDPVIASDGQTYERAAILDWVNYCHHSPTTGAPMDATFRDNIEIRNMIQSLQRQS